MDVFVAVFAARHLYIVIEISSYRQVGAHLQVGAQSGPKGRPTVARYGSAVDVGGRIEDGSTDKFTAHTPPLGEWQGKVGTRLKGVELKGIVGRFLAVDDVMQIGSRSLASDAQIRREKTGSLQSNGGACGGLKSSSLTDVVVAQWERGSHGELEKRRGGAEERRIHLG